MGVHEGAIKSAWDRMAAQMGEANDHLFFGVRTTSVDLSTLHPGPVQIFKLWQVYLDHVNPLLKATHTPSLQARIVTAVSELRRIDPNLEALMFGIYCVAVVSMVDASCADTFGESKNDLLTRYQFGCQQALLNASFLRTTNTDCLAALVFYLVRLRRAADCDGRKLTLRQDLGPVQDGPGVPVVPAQRRAAHRPTHRYRFRGREKREPGAGCRDAPPAVVDAGAVRRAGW